MTLPGLFDNILLSCQLEGSCFDCLWRGDKTCLIQKNFLSIRSLTWTLALHLLFFFNQKKPLWWKEINTHRWELQIDASNLYVCWGGVGNEKKLREDAEDERSNNLFYLFINFILILVCACVFIFFYREGFFCLQDVQDIIEGTYQRSCVLNINLGASAKFLHLVIWKCHISPPKTKTSATANRRENDMIYWRPAKRWYILI